MSKFIIECLIKYYIVTGVFGTLAVSIFHKEILQSARKKNKNTKYKPMYTTIPTTTFYKLGQHLTEEDRNRFVVLYQSDPDVFEYIDPHCHNFYKFGQDEIIPQDINSSVYVDYTNFGEHAKDNSSITGDIINRNMLNDMIEEESNKYLY